MTDHHCHLTFSYGVSRGLSGKSAWYLRPSASKAGRTGDSELTGTMYMLHYLLTLHHLDCHLTD